jgi:hypothetical protein
VDLTLLNTQKREVFDLLQSSAIDPLQFDWDVVGSAYLPKSKVSVLFTKPTGEFSFKFDYDGEDYRPYCSPWAGVREAELKFMPWSGCLVAVATWAELAQSELNTLDPWKALPGLMTTTDIAVAANVANTEFSHRETERLADALEEIRRLLLDAVGNSKEKAEIIEAQLKSLRDASERMGRKDWVNQALGAIMTLSITLLLSPETTKQALEILRQALTGLVHLAPHIIATGRHLV